ncbi:MAG: hypothetical protein IKN55_11160 [Oscillospiraceae bacterium]|nr:hypothetical protein [Oscillospiraceae bacterium]
MRRPVLDSGSKEAWGEALQTAPLPSRNDCTDDSFSASQGVSEMDLDNLAG